MNKSEMLLVEDLLLLLLDDESGTIAGEGLLHFPLGGAVLAELALAGKVRTEGTTVFYGPKVVAIEGDPPSDPLLSSAYTMIAERPRGVQTLLLQIGSDLRTQVLDRLVARELIRRESKRTLGIFRTTRLPANDPLYEADLLESVRAVLEDGREPDARGAALVALLSSTGTLPQFGPRITWSGKVFTRGKEFESGNWAAEAVSLAMIQTATARSISSAIVAPAASNSKS